MSIATRTARPNGGAPRRAATGAVAMDPASARHEGGGRPQPVVVIDLPRVVQRFRELRAALPWMDVRYDACALAHPALLATLAADGAGFVATHESALPVLRHSGVAPATARITVLASAGRGVAADAISLVTGRTERFADPATASALIDAGAEVVVLRARHRIPRPRKARTTWSPAG